MVRVNGTGHCSNCSFQCPGDDLVRKERRHADKSMPHEMAGVSRGEEETFEKERQADQATVSEQCPKCNHDRASFYTMQLRSADEGQTVFSVRSAQVACEQ